MIGELPRRFGYHAPDAERGRRHAEMRNHLLEVALTIDANVPDGREKSLAITHLEEAMFWANAGIAREPRE